jgi:N-acetyl sugar amidotransferase
MTRDYQQCSHCILDTHDDPSIVFDKEGVCNYCNTYKHKYIDNAPTAEQNRQQLEKTLKEIKAAGKGKKYDSIMGLSGGVDSSYLAYKAKEWGLNPLIVHFDNGWNSELAVKNIEGIINKTGFDLYTYVVDWEEFRDLQLSYIKASVLDWEIPTDHGFFAMLFKQAGKHNIHHILTGHNHQTEAILPKTMRWSKMDTANIIDIHDKFGKIKLKTFPMMNFFEYIYLQKVKKINRVNLLEMIDYNKDQAKELIIREFGWRDYGGKHYESIFTRFYQGYVLKEKFGYDKRKAHLSNLICSGQITRQEALDEIAKPPYDAKQLKEDKEYVIKKLEWNEAEFENMMRTPPVSHLHYKSYETGLYRQHERFMKRIKPLTRIVKKLVK